MGCFQSVLVSLNHLKPVADPMPSLKIYVDADMDCELDSRIIDNARQILLSPNPGEEKSLVKEKQRGKRSRHVFKLELDNVSYYFKLYSNHQHLKGLQDLFRGQRAKRAFDVSLTLMNLGIEVARPVAAIEMTGINCQKRSIFVTREIKGESFKSIFARKHDTKKLQLVMQHLGKLYKDLIGHRIFHYDLNLSNCWLNGDRVILLDVDDVRQVRRLGLMRLFWNIEKHNRILLRHTVRYPDSWLNDDQRRRVIGALSAKYVNPLLLNVFVKYLDCISLKHVSRSIANGKLDRDITI
jgi:hypothetical protein